MPGFLQGCQGRVDARIQPRVPQVVPVVVLAKPIDQLCHGPRLVGTGCASDELWQAVPDVGADPLGRLGRQLSVL
jgi:hypothetical protein